MHNLKRPPPGALLLFALMGYAAIPKLFQKIVNLFIIYFFSITLVYNSCSVKLSVKIGLILVDLTA